MKWIFLLVLVALEIYGYRAMSAVTRDVSGWWIKVFKIGYLVMSVYSITLILTVYLGYELPKEGGYYRYFFSLLMAWVLLIMVYSSFLLIDDLRRLIVWMIGGLEPGSWKPRSNFLYYAGALAGLLPFVALTYGMIRNMYNFKKYRTDVPISGLPAELEGLKIIQISDIHSGTFTRVPAVAKVVEMINEEQPDLILFTGDLVNEVADEVEPYVPIFARLKAKYGVYSVLGNHDYGDYVRGPERKDFDKQGNLEKLEALQKQMGWTLLRDRNELIDIKGKTLGLIGMENASAKEYFRNYGDIEKAYPGVESADVKILMSHDPSYWRSAILKKFDDIALTLSGHTHGFQFGIEIPGFIKWSPVKYQYAEWAGLYSEGNQHLYVNRGLGCLGYPGRVGILPEISVLNLKNAV